VNHLIIICSVCFQIATAYFAIRLIRNSGLKFNLPSYFAFILFFFALSIGIISLFALDKSNFSRISIDILLVLLSILIFIDVIIIGSIIKKYRNTEKEKIECKNMFNALFQNSSDEIFLNDFSGRFLEFNELVPEMLGYSANELSQMYLSDICESNEIEAMEKFVEKLRKGEFIFETELKTKAGNIYPVEIKSRYIQYSDHDVILSVSRDISERKQIERKILNAIIETEHKERERFAKDLHDQLGNILSSMNIYFQLLKSATIDDLERENLMGYFKGLLNEAIASTREIANNLNPNIITKFGIVEAIQSFCDKINKTGLIKIYLTTNIQENNLGKDKEVNLYKIITELVNNTLKHASADRIYIALSLEKSLLILKYEDNGVGFDYEKKMKAKENKGMGLFNITSRVAAMGGKINVESNKFIGIRINIQTKII